MSGGSIHDDLFYLLLYWTAIVISSYLAHLTHLSPLVYYLAFGVVFANAKITKQSPFLDSFGEVCITIVFFALGLEMTVTSFLAGLRRAWGIASIGALVPFLVGFGCTSAFWPEAGPKAAMMGGLAVTATAVSLTMIALKSEGLAASRPAIGIMTSAVLDDVASLALVAVCVPIATGEADPTVEGIVWTLGKAVLFFVSIILTHLVIFPHEIEYGPISKIPLVRDYGIHHILQFKEGEQAVLISLVVGLFFGMVAIWWGFHPAIGAYLSGLILEESYYDLDLSAGNTFRITFHGIEEAAFSWLGPVFFVHLGTVVKIEIEVLKSTIVYALVLYVALFLGQWLSATFAARYVPGGFNWSEASMVGFGMLGRAELFFVVLKICLEKGIFTEKMFFTFTTAALLLNITVPISITLFKPFYLKYNGPEETETASDDVGRDRNNSGKGLQMRPGLEADFEKWLENVVNKDTIKADIRCYETNTENAAKSKEDRGEKRRISKTNVLERTSITSTTQVIQIMEANGGAIIKVPSDKCFEPDKERYNLPNQPEPATL